MTDLFKRALLKCGQEISINLRDLEESEFDSAQPVETFTEIDTPLAIVKTLGTERAGGGSMLFDGVNVRPDATHIFCVEYDPALSPVEFQNYFVELKTKRYKILAVTNIDEKDQVLAIQATERGISTKEATEA